MGQIHEPDLRGELTKPQFMASYQLTIFFVPFDSASRVSMIIVWRFCSISRESSSMIFCIMWQNSHLRSKRLQPSWLRFEDIHSGWHTAGMGKTPTN
jgi:hypothetical protein